jgi:hypothetical protein
MGRWNFVVYHSHGFMLTFQDQLGHFEARLKKHDFLEDQLQQSQKSMQTGQGNHDKHQQLENKAGDLGFKVQ